MPAFLAMLPSLLGSRIIQIFMAAVVAYGLGWYKTRASWKASLDAYKAEQVAAMRLAREQDARSLRELEVMNNTRAVEDMATIEGLNATVADLEKRRPKKGSKGNAKTESHPDAYVSESYAHWLLQFDRQAGVAK